MTRTRSRFRTANREDRTMTETTTTTEPTPALSEYGYPIPADLADYWAEAALLVGTNKREVGDDQSRTVTLEMLTRSRETDLAAWFRRARPHEAEEKWPTSAGFEHTKVPATKTHPNRAGVVEVTVAVPHRAFSYFQHLQHAGLAEQLRHRASQPAAQPCAVCGGPPPTSPTGVCPPCEDYVRAISGGWRLTPDGRDREALAIEWLNRQRRQASA